MKSYFKRFLTVILTTALLIGSFAFITSPDSALAATKKKSQPKISISKTSVFLLKGQTTTLKVKNAKGKIVWKSSKSSVVKVSKGKLTALKAGTATITVKANKQTKKCKVTVEDPKLSETSLELEVEDEDELEIKGCNHKVTWKSSNPSVATVNDGEIVAVAAGTAVISATVHGKTFKCTVTVTEPTDDDEDIDDAEDDYEDDYDYEEDDDDDTDDNSVEDDSDVTQ